MVILVPDVNDLFQYEVNAPIYDKISGSAHTSRYVSRSISSESWNFQKWVKDVSYWSLNGLWISVLIINHKEIIDDVSYQIPWWKQVKWGHQFPCQESVNLILKVWEACWYSGAFRWGACSANVCFPLTLKQLLLIFLLNVYAAIQYRGNTPMYP